MILEEGSLVCSLPSKTQFLGSSGEVVIKPGLWSSASSCHLLDKLGIGTKWPPLVLWSIEVCASSLPFRRNYSGSTFTSPLTSVPACHCSRLPGLRNN